MPPIALTLPDKTCRGCDKQFNRRRCRGGELESSAHFRLRVYCSAACSGLQQVGRSEARVKLVHAAPTEAILAYIAGIIDGEGSVTVGIRSPRTRSREVNPALAIAVMVTMTDEGLIRWLQSATGLGRVYFQAKHHEKHKDAWMWTCSVSDSVALLEAILPFLRLKRPQASLFLELAEIRGQGGKVKNKPERQMEIAKTIQALNKRGR